MAYDPEAVYIQNVADISLQESQEETSFTQAAQNAESNNTFQEGLITEAEPNVFKANDNRANRGGILTSGVNAGRREGIVNNFANRRAQNKKTLLESREKYGTYNPVTGKYEGGSAREHGVVERTKERHGAEETRAHEKDRIGKETAAATAEGKREEERHREAQGLSPVQTVPEVSGTTPQPITGGAKPRVKGKYVKGGKVVPATTPGAIYQAWE